MIQKQLATRLDGSTKAAISLMYNNDSGIAFDTNGRKVCSPQLIKKSASFDKNIFNTHLQELSKTDVAKSYIENSDKSTKGYIENANQVLRPLSPYEKLLGDIIEPKEIPFGVEYSFANGNLSKKDITINDVIKPHRQLRIDSAMTTFSAAMIDYSNGNLVIQSGTNSSPFDSRNKQVVDGDITIHSTPVLSYSSQFQYSESERNLLLGHNILNMGTRIDARYSKFLRDFEEQYFYDIFNSNDPLIENFTLFQQEGDTPKNDLGIPNNVNGLADSSLTMNQFQNLLVKIYQNVLEKSASIKGGIANEINTFILPLTNAVALASVPAVLSGDALNNIGYQTGGNTHFTRLDYLVNYFQSKSIKVIATNQLNPSSSTGAYNSEIASTMNPANAVKERNRNTVDRPFYILTNDNSGNDQDILFAPKITFFQSGFVNADHFGLTKAMYKHDLFSGIKYMRPELNRVVITTNPA